MGKERDREHPSTNIQHPEKLQASKGKKDLQKGTDVAVKPEDKDPEKNFLQKVTKVTKVKVQAPIPINGIGTSVSRGRKREAGGGRKFESSIRVGCCCEPGTPRAPTFPGT